MALTKVQKFYVQNNLNLGLRQLSKDLGITIKEVKNFIDKLPKKTEESEPRTTTVPAKLPKARDLVIKRTASDKKGVYIMTDAASQMSDESKKTGGSIYEKYNHCVTKCLKDE